MFSFQFPNSALFLKEGLLCRFFMVLTISVEFGLHAGNMKFGTQKEKINMYPYNFV